MSLRLLPVLLSAVVALGGCIFGVSTSGNGAENADSAAPEDTESPADAGETAPMDTTDGGPTDLDTGNLDADGDGGMDTGPLPCRPGSEPQPRDTSFRDATDVDTSGDASALFEGPEVVYVTESGKIGVLFIGRTTLVRREITVTNKIQALGPSVEFDDDEFREIPYIERRGEMYTLKVVEIRDSASPEFVAGDLGYADSSRIGIADFDDDCRPDLVWADGIQPEDGDAIPAIRRVDADEMQNPKVVAEPAEQPWAVMGAIDLNDTGQGAPDGKEELYWYDTSGQGRFVVDDDSGMMYDTNEGFTSVGSSNSSPGVGGPAWISGLEKTIFPIVDGNNDPVRLTATIPDPVPLDNSGTAVASPVGTGDVDRDGRREVVFVDNGGKLRSVAADVVDASNSETRAVEVEGNDIDAKKATGVVTGTSRFFRRVDQQ